MIQRGGAVVMRRLAHVPHRPSKPLLPATLALGTGVDTEADARSSRLEAWGSAHASGCPRRGEEARDDEGEGFHDVHVQTLEGLWSLRRAWRRPHRGISQDNLPLSLGFCEFVPNVRRRGQALLGALLELLLTEFPESILSLSKVDQSAASAIVEII